MLPDVEIPDVDLDVKDRDGAVAAVRNFVQASQVVNDELMPHNTGLYFQKIPVDPVTGLAALPYHEAELLGFFKVDVIPNHVYDLVESNEELEELLAAPVNWDWFQDARFFEADDARFRLTHLAKHQHLCERYPPASIKDIAVLLAIIRPRKKYLVGQSWEKIKETVWEKLDTENQDHYFFKKSHGTAFAILVALHAKLIARHLSEVDEFWETPDLQE